MSDLYKNIKNRRIELGMTQTQLAKELGYADKSMIAKIEKGIVDLPQSKILGFAEVLGITPSALMGLDNMDFMITLNDQEKTLIEYYRAFPEDTKKRLTKYAELLKKVNEMEKPLHNTVQDRVDVDMKAF